MTNSERRQRILDFIRRSIGEKGYAPSISEIMQGCGIKSRASVQHHLSALEKEGYIRRTPSVFRSIQLVTDEESLAEGVVEVPLLGSVAAGQPIPVPESDSWVMVPEEMIKLPEELLRGRKNVYALRVKGRSMIDMLIDDGDIVIMEPSQSAEDGDAVVVWLKDQQEVTLKKIYRDRGRVRLQPANPRMNSFYVLASGVEIQGRLLAVIRRTSS
ncbi:MAG: transcriptional repressor LexA [Dehalococcoidia bacterium]